MTLHNDPVPSPKFQFIDWLVFAGPGNTCTDKHAQGFRQVLVCGSDKASSNKMTASENDFSIVRDYFENLAVDGRLTDDTCTSL